MVYRAACSLITANAFDAEGEDEHFDWCAAALTQEDATRLICTPPAETDCTSECFNESGLALLCSNETRLYLRLRTEFLVGQAFLCTADEPYLLTNRIADEPRSENNGSLQKQRA